MIVWIVIGIAVVIELAVHPRLIRWEENLYLFYGWNPTDRNYFKIL